MSNKIICTVLLILFILLIILIINRKKYYHENFKSKSGTDNKSKSNAWTTNQDQLEKENEYLTDNQKKEVKNMIQSITKSELKTLIATQSPLLTGPHGPQGIQGPAGTKLIASGRLVNKKGSFLHKTSDNKSNDYKDKENNYFIPEYVVTRTEGTNPTSSLAFMSRVSPFVSYQNWHLDIDNNLVNRYDGNCLTMDPKQEELYIDKCNNNPNQKWMWDSSNRIISTTASTNNSLKCIGLSKLENNVLTTNIPGCSGEQCITNTPRKFLVIKDCDVNNVNDDELWSFV